MMREKSHDLNEEVKMARYHSNQFCLPVAIVSVAAGDKVNIMTAAWVGPLSHHPPIIYVSISPKRYTHDLILEAGEFSLNILTDKQRELSTVAGTISGRKEDKLKHSLFKQEPGIKVKAPRLKDVRAVMECKLINHFAAGDHTVFVGEVVNFINDEDKSPLILFNHKYHKLGEYLADYP
jgi:flavin reductase (DIM6/NTAB) family NADH-FMN oxidoreductase RutF